MKTLLLLILAVLLPSGAVSAAPTGNGPHVPGDLARDRLQGMDSLLLSSDGISVAQSGQVGVPLSKAQAKIVSERLSDLVLDDALYVENAQYVWYGDRRVLTVGRGLECVTVSIRRDRPYLTLSLFGGNRVVGANYSLVLPKIIRLLQTLDPSDRSLSTFHPLSPTVTTPKGIPASALARIATLKPGMTRADLRRVFTTEGGLSMTYWNHYVYQNRAPSAFAQGNDIPEVNQKLIKVNVDFAPSDADILWLNGHGFWLHQSDYHVRSRPMSFDGQPDDIILRVSPPYLDYPSDN